MIANRLPTTHHPSVVLALGGGGARGLAHLGVVQAIIEFELEIERIVGVSVGSLVAAMSAIDLSPQQAQHRMTEYLASKEFAENQRSMLGADEATANVIASLMAGRGQFNACNLSAELLGRVFQKPSLLDDHVLKSVIAALVPDIDISETEIPLSIIAVDLKSGLPVVLENGPLRLAINASMAVPGFFPSVRWEDMLLCDLGVINSLPSQIARGSDTGMVIGVDVGAKVSMVANCPTAIQTLLRMDEIGDRLFRRMGCHHADLLICPDVGGYAWHDFSQPGKLIHAGWVAARQALMHELPKTKDSPPPQSQLHSSFRIFNPLQWLTGG